MIEPGEAITLDDNQDYLCADTIQLNDKHYLYLVTVTEPVKVCFAEQIIVNDKPQISVIGNQAEKLKILAALQAQIRAANAQG